MRYRPQCPVDTKKNRIFSWRRLASVPAWLLTGMLAGCSVLPAPDGEPVHWRLVAPSLEAGPVPGHPPVAVRLTETRAGNAIDRRDMAYSRSPQSLAYYRDNRWVASPAQMLDEVIDEGLSARSWVRNVVRGGARVSTDIALYCEILQLEHQLEYVEGRVRLKVACSWYRAEDRELVDTLQFDRSVDIERNDAEHFAAGAQRLVTAFMASLVEQGRGVAAGVADAAP